MSAPDIEIVTPSSSLSHLWEVTTDTGTALFDDFRLMVDFLAAIEERRTLAATLAHYDP
jgi:hypothetical protein